MDSYVFFAHRYACQYNSVNNLSASIDITSLNIHNFDNIAQ